MRIKTHHDMDTRDYGYDHPGKRSSSWICGLCIIGMVLMVIYLAADAYFKGA